MFNVRVASPLALGNPVELDNIGNAIASGSMTTNIFGGFVSASLTLRPGWRDVIPPGAHVEIYAPGEGGGGHLVWEGKRRRPRWAGRDLATCELAGYSVADMDCNPLETANLATAGTAEITYPAAECLATAISQTSTITVNRSQWGSPAVQHPLSLFDGRTPWQVADQLSTEIGFDMQVWEGRQAVWVQRTPPSTPDYLVAMDDCEGWEVDDSTVFNRVFVNYTDHATQAKDTVGPFTDWDAVQRIGGIRATIVQAGTTDEAGATAFGETYLAAHVFPVVTASLGPRATMRRPNGDKVPAWLVRSGQWVQIGDLLEQSERGTVVIVQTTVDWSGMLTAQLGQLKRDITGMFTELQRVAVAVKQGSNPNSGAAVA